MPGKVLGGRYQVQDRIGTGGMATVFRGRDDVLGRTVAIKTMLPQYAADPSFAARFKQEAQAAAALQSPYIVSVYDWGKDGDTYFIVMEYLRGADLKSGIRKHGALDCKKVAQIGSQIAQALSVAHKHDIIHRDIKPQNIMVQPDGNIKVMDFGIARAKNSHLTQGNSVLGTAHYVSPEQTQGKDLGPTTDIYSLGIVMYESATGQVPFQGDDAISVALKQVNEQPKPPSQLNPSIDPSLEAIILKCMQKDPAARFQTADELNRALRDYLAGRMSAVASATAASAGATAVLGAAVTNKLEVGRGVTAVSRIQRDNRYRQSATEKAAEQEAERYKKSRRRKAIGIAAGIAAAVALIAVVVAVLGSGSKTYSIPNLSGLTKDEAIAAIQKDGHFTYGGCTEQYDSTIEAGYVVDQSPNQGREYEEGTSITFTVSKGPEPAASVTVPDLTNMTVEEAEAELTKYKLKGKSGNSKASDSVDVGKVCDQSVEAGTTAKAGDTITYYLSKGPDKLEVPDVRGYSEAAARTKLSKAGFTNVSATYQSSSSVDVDCVISVSPSAGTKLTADESIVLTLSSGPADTRIEVPYVIGESYSEAKTNLESQGFNVMLASGSSSNGTVTYQSVTDKAEKGTTITLTTKSNSSNNSSTGSGSSGSSSTGSGNSSSANSGGSSGSTGSDSGDNSGSSGSGTDSGNSGTTQPDTNTYGTGTTTGDTR
ncbi:Stk1 family PASTA domain-containing Ser/Thr kinase [Paratractidigestivibacter sp.]|uniref:Stk1 family PASTA domain-containing Ser/Thr kinase n=1 Tax=Paratractidigestivibacter sp. TaxID=2847316 RepID=UPI002ABE3762|nr:Stk1 family PASTA domain-containing Ser/Thr kinase [Paratractidigestivibacter sp.]